METSPRQAFPFGAIDTCLPTARRGAAGGFLADPVSRLRRLQPIAARVWADFLFRDWILNLLHAPILRLFRGEAQRGAAPFPADRHDRTLRDLRVATARSTSKMAMMRRWNDPPAGGWTRWLARAVFRFTFFWVGPIREVKGGWVMADRDRDRKEATLPAVLPGFPA